MKLNISLSQRIHQLLCKHENVGWASYSKGINRKQGSILVNFECVNCGISVNEWFKDDDRWIKNHFPDIHTRRTN